MSDHQHRFSSRLNDWHVSTPPYCDYAGNVALAFEFPHGVERRAVHLDPDDADALATILRERANEGRAMRTGGAA